MIVPARPRFLLRFLLLLALCGALLPRYAFAQDSGAAEVEALARRVHLQNLRTHSFTFWVGGNLGAPENQPHESVIGQHLSGYRLTGLAGDADVTPQTLTRPALFNFWASWCPPCQLEFPHLVRVALAPEDHAFDVIFVNMSDSLPDALDFLAGEPPEIHTVVDEGDRLAYRALIESIPTSVLLNTDGTVLAVHVGVMTPTVSDFLSAVAAHPGVGTFTAGPDLAAPGADLLPVDADSAAPIQPGQRVLGVIEDAAYQQVYRFEGHAGDTVTIRMEADFSALDAYLVLMTAQGERLAENDDADDATTNSEIQATLPADGTYLVVATRFLEAEGFAGGDYSLTLALHGAGGTEPQPGVLTYGATVQGRVSGGNPREFYSFDGRAGDVVTLRVQHEPGGAALRVELKDPHLNRLGISPESVNGAAALEQVTLPEDGRYLVVVMRPRGRDVENTDYSLTLDSDAAPGEEMPQTAPTAAEPTLAYGQTVGGTLDDTTYEQRWTFSGSAGDVITAVMQRVDDVPGGLDGALLLLGPDGVTLADVDDSGDSIMPRLDSFALPAAGQYTLVATRFGRQNGFSSGAYTLSLARAAGTAAAAPPPEPALETAGWTGADPAPGEVHPIRYNERAGGTLSGDQFEAWYSFEGRAGDVITIRMQADRSTLDPYLALLDASGEELSSADDLGASRDAALLDFTLPATATYLIRATRYGYGNGPSSGDYTLIIETEAAPPRPEASSAPLPLAYGRPVSGSLSADQVASQYAFDGHAGDVITISARQAPGSLVDVALSLRDAAGTEIAFNRSGLTPGEARIARLALPGDGRYVLDVVLEDLSTAGRYDLLLLAERRAPARH